MSAEVETEKGPSWAVKNALKISPALCLPCVCLLFTTTRYAVRVYVYMFTCMQVLVCVHTCVCACVFVCACMSVHMEAKDLHCCSSGNNPLVFFSFLPLSEKDLSLAWDSSHLCLPPQHWDSTHQPLCLAFYMRS